MLFPGLSETGSVRLQIFDLSAFLDFHCQFPVPFLIFLANPIILEVTKGTTKINNPSIRPLGGIPFNKNHPSGMPTRLIEGFPSINRIQYPIGWGPLPKKRLPEIGLEGR